jgi:hypothetical protein
MVSVVPVRNSCLAGVVRSDTGNRRLSGALHNVVGVAGDNVHAEEREKDSRPYGGNGKWERQHAALLRTRAAELLAGLPH